MKAIQSRLFAIFALVAILTWMTTGWMARAEAEELPYAEDLVAEGKLSDKKQAPILILFMAPYCSYCERVHDDFLLPTSRNADYDAKVILRQIDVTSQRKMRDFSGKTITQAQFAARYKVQLTPTVKLFDSQGREVSRPIVGLITPDFYGGFLDNAINEGLERIRGTRVAKGAANNS